MREARYAVAKHTPDLIRQEPRNVGVFLQWRGRTHARFLGQTKSGGIDRRVIRSKVLEPDVYEQWVSFWLAEIEKHSVYDPIARREVRTGDHLFFEYLSHMSKENFAIVEGGAVGRTLEADTAEDILSFLFASLVGEGGFQAAVAATALEGEEEDGVLRADVSRAFKDLGILGRADEELIHPHFVIPGLEISGTLPVPHRPDFVQRNGRTYVMATADFALAQKIRQQEHAGAAAFVFGDLKAAHGDRVETISICRMDSQEDARVRWAVAALRKQADRFVDWDDDGSREAFLLERVKLAQQRQ